MSAEQDNTIDYSLLTDEEIEAIGAEPSPEELITMRQEQEAANLADDDDDDIDDPGEETGKQESGEQEKAEDQPQPKPATQEAVDVPYEATLPEDFEEKREAIKTERAELKERYKNGEIDFDEYEDQREALADREKELDREAVKAEIAQDMSAQSARKAWANRVNSFLDESARSGLDYRADKAKHDELDFYVKTLASNPANADKDSAWFLKTADEIVRAQHGIAKQSTKPGDKPSRKAPVDKIPQTLAHVPGGDDTSESQGKFDDIDKLDGLDYERALARMSPEQRDEYLRGQ